MKHKDNKMEELIVSTARKAIKESIIKNLTDYNSPFSKMVKDVIADHEAEFKVLLNDEVSNLLQSKGFKDTLKDALHTKLAKVLVSRLGGELEKRVNELKQSPTTRAKIILAINKIVEEEL